MKKTAKVLSTLTISLVSVSVYAEGPLANFEIPRPVEGLEDSKLFKKLKMKQGPQYQTLYVDCDHKDLKTSKANTKDSIRADFYKGTDMIASVGWKGTKCGATKDQLYMIRSSIMFDNVILSTDGSDAFWPDEIGYSFQETMTGNSELASLLDKWDGEWGQDNGGVWCLSKQKSDRSGKDGGCFPAIKFTLGKGKQTPLLNYKPPAQMSSYWMQVDCYDSAVSNSETSNLITMQLWNGTTPVRGGSWSFTPDSCSSTSYRDTSMSFNTPPFTHFTLSTNGDNGYWIDQISLQTQQFTGTGKGTQFFNKYEWSRNHDEKGYCLSTDSSDNSRTWKGKMHDGKCSKTVSFDLSTLKATGSSR